MSKSVITFNNFGKTHSAQELQLQEQGLLQGKFITAQGQATFKPSTNRVIDITMNNTAVRIASVSAIRQPHVDRVRVIKQGKTIMDKIKICKVQLVLSQSLIKIMQTKMAKISRTMNQKLQERQQQQQQLQLQ